MPTEVKMPQMGESIAEGTLTRWFKKPGDRVTRDEPLFEISTDKVDAEIPAPADGVLTEIRVQEGTTVEVNTIVGLLEESTASQASAQPGRSTTPAAKTTPETKPDTKPAAGRSGSTAPAQAAASPAAGKQGTASSSSSASPSRSAASPGRPAAASGSGAGAMTEVKMPQMGESIAEGTLTRWFKKVGESVQRDEPLFEISTDKVDAEIPAPADGVLAEIRVQEGTTVEVNTVVGLLASSAGAASPTEAAKPAVDGNAARPAVADGADQARAARSADAATGARGPSASEPVADGSDNGPAVARTGSGDPVRSSPLVRRIAREHGIEDLGGIAGSGQGGRVTKSDILAHVEQRGQRTTAARAAPTAAPGGRGAAAAAHGGALPVQGLPRTDTRTERLTIMRRKIAEHMIESRRTSAHVQSVFEADMTQVVAARERHKKAFEARHGVKLTFTTFFARAAARALVEFPYVNASLDGDEILLHQHVNLGIAVSLDGGLIVPVIRRAQELSLVGLQQRITDLATRARSKQLKPDEVAGGTFTITNPGQYGGLFGIPIINQPQVAILGLGGIQKRPVVVGDNAIAIRDMVYLCLSYDHRLVDGALADQFMARLKSTLESWDVEALEG